MKRFLSFIILLIMLMSSVSSFAATGGSGAYNPVILDEIQKGTVIAFDSEKGDFNTTTYYVKILGEDNQEYIYPLAKNVEFENVTYTAKEITAMELGEITYVLRSDMVKYINPILPDGLFESVEVIDCYLKNDTIYANVEFENIVDEFKLVMAGYSNNVLCSVKSFDISYLDSYYELEMPANDTEIVKLFLWESVFGLVPLCEKKVHYIPTMYGYLLSVTEEENENKFEIFTTGNNAKVFDCAEEIYVNEEMFLEGDSSIEDRLEFSSESANSAYPDETNAIYHQPVMYALNEKDEITHIDTVVSGVNEKISKLADSKAHYSAYSYSQYKSKSFGDFKVGQDTVFFFAPDDRSDKEGYGVYHDFLKTFINNMSYHVEAYGLDEDKVASLVMVYKTLPNIDDYYPSSSPMMIVNSKVLKQDGSFYITGYTGTSYSLMHVDVNLDEVENISAIGKGDIIRYKTNNYSEMIDYQIWYDASDAVQEKACSDINSAIANRILEISAASLVPVVNTPNASFRLQYGTVSGITLSNSGNSISVTPSIANDNFAMVTEGSGVVEWEFESSVKVFQYTDGQVLTQAELSDIILNKTQVIAYSSQGKLIMLYIVKQPYISNKKIMVVEKGTGKTNGCELTGYSEGEKIIVTVDAEKEPIVSEVYAGKIIAYVPDGDTIKDIEIVYSMPLKPFNPEKGESFISTDTKETVIFGPAEYSTSKITINGVDYTTTDDTNYLLLRYVTGGANKLIMGIGSYAEMKNSYVLIRVKDDNPTVICDAMIFQNLN